MITLNDNLGGSWPPRPKDWNTNKPCKATRNHLVTYDFCKGINTGPGRLRHCNGCPVSWRICNACILQRASGDDIRVIDSETGLCSFHTKNGAGAVRPTLPKRTPMPDISVSEPKRLEETAGGDRDTDKPEDLSASD